MIKDPRSSLESKGVQFPGRDAPDKISRGGLSAFALGTSKICGFASQNTKTRIRSDEREQKNPSFVRRMKNLHI